MKENISYNPLLTVIMSVHNNETFLKESIESIIFQTFNDFEFLIIDDNSTDNSYSIIKYYQQNDSRIILKRNNNNFGLTRNLNLMILMAKGKYIARMDADDISMPTRLEKQVEFMESHPNVIVCGTKVCYFGQENVNNVKWIKSKNIDLKNRLFTGSCFAHPTVMIRKDILDKSNILYDETYIYGQDYKLWVDLSSKGEYFNLPETLLKYRKSKSQISSSKADLQRKNSYLARKQYFFDKLKNFDSSIQFNLPVIITYDTYNELIKVECIFKKNKNYDKYIRNEFTHMFNSLIYHTHKIEFKLFIFLFMKRIVFRKDVSFYEIFRLLKRSVVKL